MNRTQQHTRYCSVRNKILVEKEIQPQQRAVGTKYFGKCCVPTARRFLC